MISLVTLFGNHFFGWAAGDALASAYHAPVQLTAAFAVAPDALSRMHQV
jgi:hypothetical protein